MSASPQPWRVLKPSTEKPLAEIAPIASRLLSEIQIGEAHALIDAPSENCLVWPYASLHAIAGLVAPGRLVLVAAHTGQGKTTFMLDLLDQWADRGLKLHFHGTEQQPKELWCKWACKQANVPAHVAINREWAEYHDPTARARVHEAFDLLRALYGSGENRVRFVPDKFVTLVSIEKAAKLAAEEGVHALLIDHIDRVDHGAERDQFRAMTQLVRRLKEIALENDLVIVAASQINRAGREGGRLAAYYAPELHHMRGAGTKEEESDLVLALHRPIRGLEPGESSAEFKDLHKRVLAGTAPVSEVIQRDVMRVTIKKHRTRGNEGQSTDLTLMNGNLQDQRIIDRYTTTCGAPPK